MKGIEKNRIKLEEGKIDIFLTIFCKECNLLPYIPFLCNKKKCQVFLCMSCLEGKLEKSCPTCNSSLSNVKFVVNSVLSKVSIYCKYRENGCFEILPYSDIYLHDLNCLHNKIKCSSDECNYIDTKLNITNHEKKCNFFINSCKFCFKFNNNNNENEGNCCEMEIKCKLCNLNIKRMNIISHNLLCNLKNIEEKYEKYGVTNNFADQNYCLISTNIEIIERLKNIDSNHELFKTTIKILNEKLTSLEKKIKFPNNIKHFNCVQCKINKPKSNLCCNEIYCSSCIIKCRKCNKECCLDCCKKLNSCKTNCDNIICNICEKQFKKISDKSSFYNCQKCDKIFCNMCNIKKLCKLCYLFLCEKCYHVSCNNHTIIQLKHSIPIVSYNDSVITNLPFKTNFPILSDSITDSSFSLLENLKPRTEIFTNKKKIIGSNCQDNTKFESNEKFFDTSISSYRIFTSNLGSINEFDIIQNKIIKVYDNVHEGNIKSIVKIKQNLITCSFDGYVKLFNSNFNNKIWEHQIDPSQEISQLIALNDYEFACVTSSNKSAIVFNLNNADKIKLKLCLDSWLLTLAKYHEDLILIGGNDSHIYFWSLSTNSIIKKINCHNGSIINYIIRQKINNPNCFISSGQDKYLNFWDINGQNILSYDGNIVKHWYSTIKEHFDGRIITACNDYSIKLFDNKSKESTKFSYHENFVYDFLPLNENYFLSASSDYSQCLWDIRKINTPVNYYIHPDYPLRFFNPNDL